MNRALSFSALFVFLAVSASAQGWKTAADITEGARGTLTGTVVDVDEGANRLQIEPDADRFGRVLVITDSVSTQYNGFGTVINGQPEIFMGSTGFANVRLDDRVDIRGTGTSNRAIRADFVTLVGRAVAASQVGVGQSRTPTSVSTPTTTAPTPQANRTTRVEGIIRQINETDGRIVLETDGRELINVRAGSTTPVYFNNATYRVGDLETGDRVRIETDNAARGDREIRARSITVLEDVRASGTTERRQFTVIEGRVSSIDRTQQILRVNTGRTEVRVDVTNANGSDGRRVRVDDFKAGDNIRAMGNYLDDNIFSATTISFNEDVFREPAETGFAEVSLSVIVVETLDDSPQLIVRDRTANRTYTIWVTDDFVVRTKAGGYTTAASLKVNDSLLIKAYRDELGNYIAQNIRVR